MLKIGEFSKLSEVSIRMLRHYDEIDLLKPVKIDEFTGYRYYDEEQLYIMVRINSLKKMGFGLAAVKDILKAYEDKEELEKYLMAQQTELYKELKEVNGKIELLERALKSIRKDETMKYDVVIKTLPERKVASVRQIIPSYKDEGILWDMLFKETEKSGLRLAEPVFMGAVLHDNEYKDENVDIEVQAAVVGDYTDTENVIFKTEPEITVASVVFNGPYEQFGSAYAAIADWVSKNGYKFAGALRNIYHKGYYETQNVEEFITEVCCPICKA